MIRPRPRLGSLESWTRSEVILSDMIGTNRVHRRRNWKRALPPMQRNKRASFCSGPGPSGSQIGSFNSEGRGDIFFFIALGMTKVAVCCSVSNSSMQARKTQRREGHNSPKNMRRNKRQTPRRIREHSLSSNTPLPPERGGPDLSRWGPRGHDQHIHIGKCCISDKLSAPMLL